MNQASRLIIVAAATALMLNALAGQAADSRSTKMKVVEQAIETSAAQIVLPSGGAAASAR